jgi:hypothetical protein
LATCEAIKNNGKRCEAKVQTGSQWCWNHDPAHTAKRKASGSMGGKRGGRGRPLLELQQTKAYLKKLRDEVLAGVVDRGDATIANQITNTYVRCISTELRERMELLEAEVEAAAAARGYGGDGSRPGMDYGA